MILEILQTMLEPQLTLLAADLHLDPRIYNFREIIQKCFRTFIYFQSFGISISLFQFIKYLLEQVKMSTTSKLYI